MSVVTSCISTVLCLALALPTAYALTRTNMPCKRVAEVLMELTLSLPYILLGFALLLIFSSPFGKALKDIGLAVVFQPAGIVLAQLIVNLPFAIRMIKTAFLDVNPRMEFVAKNAWSNARRGVSHHRPAPLPQRDHQHARPHLGTRMGEFGATLMLVGVTRMKTETLPGSIYLSISTGNNETAMATAMIMLIPPRRRSWWRICSTSRSGQRTRRRRRRARRNGGAMAGSIRIDRLLVTRGSFTLRVDELTVRPREIFAILGETGAGKTVLLEAIAGAYPVDEGAIELDGKNIETLPVQQRHLGIVYQDYALFPT